MARPFDPAALRHLNAPLRARRGLTQPNSARMGYQPALDGLRALSVLVVIAYDIHVLGGGFAWFRGGFLGVEVFFVISGFLITSLLIEEWGRDGRIAVGQFWGKRLRRLAPALLAMLLLVGVASSIFRADTLSRLRSDMPSALFYFANWRQIFDHAGYFATYDSPPLLHHLWSLGIEEQWYLIWPLAFIGLMNWVRGEARQIRIVLFALSIGAAVAVPLVYQQYDSFRLNFAYLATFTRIAGLLLGAALASFWTPWRWHRVGNRDLGVLDGAGLFALVGLGVLVARLHGTSPHAYELRLFVVAGPRLLPGGLFAASILSAVAIAAAVHPGALTFRRLLAAGPLVAVGRRSYGLYLWHWPVFVLLRAGDGVARLVLALAITVVMTEASYRVVELPLRRGAWSEWFARMRTSEGSDRRSRLTTTTLYGFAVSVLVVAVAVRLLGTNGHPLEVDPSAVAFDSVAAQASGRPNDPSATVVAGPATTAPRLPRKLVLIGDEQAHSLALNRPSGLDELFTVTDGSTSRCGIWDEGALVTARPGFHKSFADCSGSAKRWVAAARSGQADVAVLALGAWDVFDVSLSDGTLTFGSEEGDRRFLSKLDAAVEAVKTAGVKIALLEVPCMSPVDVAGSTVPALPERADGSRIAHLNDLLREAAADDPAFVSFVRGPAGWCAENSTVAADRTYRFNGVEYFKLGAKLEYEAITTQLLHIPV